MLLFSGAPTMLKKLLFTFTGLLSLILVNQASALVYAEFNSGYVDSGNATLNVNDLNLNRKKQGHFGWNANIGVQLPFIIGVEVGYTDFNKLAWQQANATSTNSKLYGYHLAAVKQFDLGPVFIRGKLGVGQVQRGSFDIDNIHINDKKHTNLFWGAGVGMNISPTIYALVQYQQIQGSGGTPNMNLTSLGAGISF
jgi:hypothetical protein